MGAAGQAVLLGVTRQLVGASWCGAGGFVYAGSLGPLPLSDARRGAWQRIGSCLAARFQLVGLFGVDAVVEGNRIWTVEVNPRYTASVEVLERGLQLAALRWHAAACGGEALPAAVPTAVHGCCGKAIVYARREVAVADEFVAGALRACAGAAWPDVADVPRAGWTIARGRPVTTVLAAGRGAAEVTDALQQRARQVQQRLGC